MKTKYKWFTLFISVVVLSCSPLKPETPSVTYEDLIGTTWYGNEPQNNLLNTIYFTRDTVYHIVDYYSPRNQINQNGDTLKAGQVTRRALKKGYAYNRGQSYKDGDGEILYIFSIQWKEYVWDSDIPIYDWSVYQRWWIGEMSTKGELRWGIFDESRDIQLGWIFVPKNPVNLNYDWYQ